MKEILALCKLPLRRTYNLKPRTHLVTMSFLGLLVFACLAFLSEGRHIESTQNSQRAFAAYLLAHQPGLAQRRAMLLQGTLAAGTMFSPLASKAKAVKDMRTEDQKRFYDPSGIYIDVKQENSRGAAESFKKVQELTQRGLDEYKSREQQKEAAAQAKLIAVAQRKQAVAEKEAALKLQVQQDNIAIEQNRKKFWGKA